MLQKWCNEFKKKKSKRNMHEQASDVVLLCTELSVSVQTREKKRDGSDDRGLNKAQ